MHGISKQSSRANFLLLVAMSLGYAVVQLDVTIVNVALNSIGASYGGSVAALQWVVNPYTIAFAAFILSAGALGDRIGAKRVFMAGFAIFTLASLACALASTLAMLIAARVMQGLGAALLVPNSLALLNHAYPDGTARGRAVGIWAAGASIALTAGPFVGGALIALGSWRSIFLVNLPIGLVGLLLTWRRAKETPRSPGRTLDLPGQATAIVALGCLAAAMIEAGPFGFTHPLVLGGIAASVALGILFVTIERRAPQPMLPLALFGRRAFAVMSLAGLLINIGFYGLIFVFSLYFQRVNRLSAFSTGLAFVPMTAAVLPANLAAARVAEAIGPRQTIVAGAAVAATACLALLGIAPHASYWTMAIQLVAMGAGLGLLVPPLTSTLLGSVEKARSGLASGVLNAMRQTGSVLGVSLFGSLVAESGRFIHGARMALAIAAALLLCGGIAVLLDMASARRPDGRELGGVRETLRHVFSTNGTP
jgi:DHA2 family methylenomycin A resistance protein-like MFS transporter